MKSQAVCIGINDYAGVANDLRGCVNDAHDWSTLLSDEYGYETRLILNQDATPQNVLGALEELVNNAENGDRIVFTYSGHGTWEYETGKDQDEADNRDEALAVYDGIILDDEIRSTVAPLDPGVSLYIVSDSCHSGGVTRAMLRTAADRATRDEDPNPPVPRFLPPENDIKALRAMLLPVRRRAFYPESTMNHVLLTGCNALEYSFDAFIGGRFNGAMTFFATQLLRGNPQQSWADLYKSLRQILPSTAYPQSPQLEGPENLKDQPVFG